MITLTANHRDKCIGSSLKMFVYPKNLHHTLYVEHGYQTHETDAHYLSTVLLTCINYDSRVKKYHTYWGTQLVYILKTSRYIINNVPSRIFFTNFSAKKRHFEIKVSLIFIYIKQLLQYLKFFKLRKRVSHY